MSTPSLTVTGINHVVLHVTDMERSLDFYIEKLGFIDRQVGDSQRRKRSFLLCGVQGIDLFEVQGDVHSGEEMNHIALNVAAEDLEPLLEELAALGIATSERTQRNTVFISDPDGHRIELLPVSSHERLREREGTGAARS